jgi:hypothetical protein
LDLSAGYTASAQLYAKEDSLSNAFETQNFVFSALSRATPRLTLTATDTFSMDRNTNIVGGFSTGRQESWTNTFGAGMAFAATPKDSLRLNAGYGLTRFTGGGSGRDSSSYAGGAGLDHQFTRRFAGGIDYTFTYLDT